MVEQNIVLIGMPGCGKSHIGKMLAKQMEREFLDTDKMIEEKTAMPVPEIFALHGEAFFRALESECAETCAKLSGKVIATGGGMVLKAENIRLLKENGRLYYLRRDLRLLPRKGRPLSNSLEALEKMFCQRSPLYLQAADCVLDNQAQPQQAMQAILEDFRENSSH